MRHEFHYGAAGVGVDYCDGLGLVELRGPITQTVIEQARLAIADVQPVDTCVYLWCWERAALAYSLEAGSARTGEDWRLTHLVSLPTGNVVSDAQCRTFERYAVAAINLGLVRVTFSQRAAALEWAARKIVFSPRRLAVVRPSRMRAPRVHGFPIADFQRTQ